jgi:hypothetical protein
MLFIRLLLLRLRLHSLLSQPHSCTYINQHLHTRSHTQLSFFTHAPYQSFSLSLTICMQVYMRGLLRCCLGCFLSLSCVSGCAGGRWVCVPHSKINNLSPKLKKTQFGTHRCYQIFYLLSHTHTHSPCLWYSFFYA